MINILAILAFGLTGGIFYRLRGGGVKKKFLARTAARLLYFTPLAITILPGLIVIHELELNSVSATTAIVLMAVCWAGVVTGHGSYMDLGTSINPDNERLKPFMDFLMGTENEPSFWRDFIGLSLTGFIVTLPIGIALNSYIVMFSGLLKGIVYFLGFAFHKAGLEIPTTHGWTEWGEFFFGIVTYSAVGYAVVTYVDYISLI